MITTHTFAVDIIIRRNKADKKKALIYARITIDGDAKEISLKGLRGIQSIVLIESIKGLIRWLDNGLR